MARYQLPDGVKPGWFTQQFQTTLNQGYSITIVAVGKRTGIGKTYGVLRLAELLDPGGFTRREVEGGKYTFYAKDFIPAIQKIERYRWAIFDESGRKESGGSKQEWQSDINKALSSTCQISRMTRSVNAFIAPHRQYIASQVLGLAQILAVFESRGYCKCYHIEPSEFDNNIYTPFMGSIKLSMPDRDLIDACEELKAKMFMADTSKWVSRIERNELVKRSTEEIAQEIVSQGRVDDYRMQVTGQSGLERTKWNIPKIQQDHRCSRAKAYEIRSMLEIDQ